MTDLENTPSEIIQYFNQKMEVRHRGSKNVLKNIRARLREGATLDEAQLVIDYKIEEWMGTDFEKYIQPSTLFRPSHFDEYLVAAKRWEARGRPKIRKSKQEEIGQRLNQRNPDVYAKFMTRSNCTKDSAAP